MGLGDLEQADAATPLVDFTTQATTGEDSQQGGSVPTGDSDDEFSKYFEWDDDSASDSSNEN